MKLNYAIIITFLLYSMFISSYAADSNGIWHYASDIRGGVFGSDEQEVTSGFSFINPVTVNDNLVVSEKLGIGTASPLKSLHVSDPLEGVIRIETSDRIWCEDACADGVTGTHSGGFIEWYDKNKRGGWVGFGNGFDGNLAIANELPGKSILLGSNFNFDTGGGFDMIISPHGDVGIGTLSPSQKLEVSGNIAARDIYSNGQIVATKNYVDDVVAGANGTFQCTYATASAGGGIHAYAICPAGYQRTGCSLQYTDGDGGTWGTLAKPYSTNGCVCNNGFINHGWVSCYAYCCRIV